ncbi:MAG: hypothetical protein JXA92_14165 [candidate division Zixibacteria bacterium]|nr:hypothetical protein [candidate division Zixibacteria bacterium]
MDWHMPNMIFSVFFLLALILVARFKKQISSVDKSSYRYLSGGIVILTFMSLARVYSNLGFFKEIPFLSEPLFYQLVSWIGVITGITFVISGVSSWLPLAQNFKKDNVEKVRQLDFIKKIEQLVNFESRADKIFESALDYMVEHFEMKRGLAFKLSPSRGQLFPVASKGEAALSIGKTDAIRFNPEGWRHFLDGVKLENSGVLTGLPEIAGQPDVVLPVVVNDKPVGFFALWCDQTCVCSREERLNMKIAADIIARKIQNEQMNHREEFIRSREKLISELRASVSPDKILKENLKVVYRVLKSSLPVDYLELVVVNHDTSKMNRFSIGGNETVLEERNINLPEDHEIIYSVLNDARLRIIDDLSRVARDERDILLKYNGMQSLLAVPLMGDRRVVGVLTAGSVQTACYRRRHSELVNYSLPVLNELVKDEKNREQITVRERRIVLMNRFVNEIERHTGMQSIFDRAATLIYDELKTTLVRIATVENRGETLNPRSFRVQPSVTDFKPERKQMILAMMPYHKLVIKSGRQVMVNQLATGEKMSSAEARIVLNSDLKTALLVPVKLRERVFAVITLAERRAWDRFRYSHLDVLFVNGIAMVLSMALQLSAARQNAASSQNRLKDLEQYGGQNAWDDGFKTRIKSALSGIMGSVEILKSQPPQTSDTGRTRYLDIIDRSARKINECFLEDKVGV